MGIQTTTGKIATPQAVRYDALQIEVPGSYTLGSTQTTATVMLPFVLPIAIKIFGLSLLFTTINGTAAMSVNICSGVGPQGGVGPIDPTPLGSVPPTAAQMAQNGNVLWATDQPVNPNASGTNVVPVINTPYTFYPVSGLWDIIWPANSIIALRMSTGASAANSVVIPSILYKPVDIHSYLPNALNPFAPTAAIL